MPLIYGDRDGSGDRYPRSVVAVQLTKADIALVIDALLQAEMTLPLLDPRYKDMKPLDHLRARQLALADQLENLMADQRTA